MLVLSIPAYAVSTSNSRESVQKALGVDTSVVVPLSVSAATGSTALRGVGPHGQLTVSGHGHGNGTFTSTQPIRGEASKINAELANHQIGRRQADSVPVGVTYVVSTKNFGMGAAGDPTVTANIYENSIVDIPLWTFQVTQSFNYDGSTVTWVSPLSWAGTSVHAPWWSINNESSSTSSPPTGTYYTQTYANAVFNYCAYWILCSETSYAEAWLNFYGSGYWSWNADYSNSF